MEYQEFLKSKELKFEASGFEPSNLNRHLFDFQKDVTRWACRRGKSAIFLGTGMGKSIIQLEWAHQVHCHTNQNVLILAPLAVSTQTEREGSKFGIHVNICREQSDIQIGINITNYERINKFKTEDFAGIVLDESGILKGVASKTKNEIISKFKNTKYKLACTATPAPNDYIELGNHCDFLDVMTRSEMLAMFFIHDGSDTAKWRLKGHVKENVFWNWMCQWAVMITKPSDLGYDDGAFILPELEFHEHIIKTEKPFHGELFVREAAGLMDRRRARRESLSDRVALAADIINSDDEQWLIWCGLNDESKMLSEKINDSIEVKGSDSVDHKEKSLLGFSTGDVHRLVSKSKIAGWGMNFQICNNMMFVGISDSYEELHQSIRREWRFGQKNKVDVHIVLSEQEGSVLRNIKRKEKDHEKMIEGMVANMKDITKKEIGSSSGTSIEVSNMVDAYGDGWSLTNGDCVDVAAKIDTESIDYTIFSPPFSNLYSYSDSMRDMGNSKTDKEFMTHFKFLLTQLFRITKQGRLVSIHCMDIPAMKERDGYIGLKDFPGDLTRMMQKEGFVYHSKCTIFKDPLIEAVRTKSLGLMHKQIQKDSTRCRQGLPDYMLTFVKPGENQEPVSHPDGFTRYIGIDEPKQTGIEYSHNVWRRYASPVWMDINQTNTLNKVQARDDKDERHIAPLQIGVIARCVELWSNPNDLVFSPFAGIGSEGYVSLDMGRKFIGSELKKSYFDVAVGNLKSVTSQQQMAFF